ncbi:MAG: hypothetical protein V7K26_18540 [Nostoc sp.]|uniref:hypothetical protein n=1 Tax=Nostoc sp. TaxID=1180 RepID=UPI002FF20655
MRSHIVGASYREQSVFTYLNLTKGDAYGGLAYAKRRDRVLCQTGNSCVSMGVT